MTVFVDIWAALSRDGRSQGKIIKTTLHYQPAKNRRGERKQSTKLYETIKTLNSSTEELTIDFRKLDDKASSIVNAVWHAIRSYHLASGSKITLMVIGHGNITNLTEVVETLSVQCRGVGIPFKTDDNRRRYMRRLAVPIGPNLKLKEQQDHS
ncbi:hypothetical protein PM082_022286 [Marasmius tenuissimus]|nr:hypothetical protein PM082_022286 [Marasmius tenuissimus]